MKTISNLIIIAITLTSAISCSSTLPPVQNVANITANVETSIDQILKTAQALHAQVNPLTSKPVVSTGQLDQVALVVDQVGLEGQNLAQMLSDYDALKASRGSTLTLGNAITSLLDDMVRSLNQIGVIIPNGTVHALDSLVTSTITLILQIKGGL